MMPGAATDKARFSVLNVPTLTLIIFIIYLHSVFDEGTLSLNKYTLSKPRRVCRVNAHRESQKTCASVIKF
jgi:hypothetical protein